MEERNISERHRVGEYCSNEQERIQIRTPFTISAVILGTGIGQLRWWPQGGNCTKL